MSLPQLPGEVWSQIASFLAPPYRCPTGSPPDGAACSTPPTCVLAALDPLPLAQTTPTRDISSLSKVCHRNLEAARPWLWEDVEVRSGRGWLAIVNALTEEVIEPGDLSIDSLGSPSAFSPTLPFSPDSQPDGVPVTPQVAHAAPATIGRPERYFAPPPSSGYPAPYTAGIASSSTLPEGLGLSLASSSQPILTYSFPSPQVSHAALLLTPPGSRNSSPHPISTSNLSASKLRGRSRSPRRSVGFDTEGISAVLDRSRSGSANRSGSSGGSWTKRVPLERRMSSLSRTRTMSTNRDDDDDEEDEADDDVAPLPERGRSRRVPTPPPVAPKGEGETEGENDMEEELLPAPGPYIRHLSFNNFRTIGSRRTQNEAIVGRFVTAGRLEGVMKNAPNMVSLCMTEYVDSSLSFPVVEELLFRGYKRPRMQRQASTSRARSLSVGPTSATPNTSSSQVDPPRPVYVPYETETEDEMWRRRAMFTPLEALDLTGCVSSVFTAAMLEFWETWYAPPDPSNTESQERRGRERGRDPHPIGQDPPSTSESEDDMPRWKILRRSPTRRHPRFGAMRRLSLRACLSISSHILTDFVLSFPHLTHLDLSDTRVAPSLLESLTNHAPRTLRLQSLSLAKCPRLDPSAIVDFLVMCPCTRDLEELNLYATPAQSNVIDHLNLDRLIESAPCMRSGRLRYLDLSGSRMTDHHLSSDFPQQPNLISLGMSHLPEVTLPAIASLLLNSAPRVEILTLTGTAAQTSLRSSAPSLQMTLDLHGKLISPLTRKPFSLQSLYLSPGSAASLDPGPTRLRVIELSSLVRRALSDGGEGEWKVIKSKGGRGWYVDVSAGWVDAPSEALDQKPEGSAAREKMFVRHLPHVDARRQWLSQLAAANGRVGSAVGWHSRKMEVVRGMGMLGREEGMAGVGGFAFED